MVDELSESRDLQRTNFVPLVQLLEFLLQSLRILFANYARFKINAYF